VPHFICPNCKERSVDTDGLEGLYNETVACHRCGFGFLFELLDDYYPAPNAAFFVCDQAGRIIGCGRVSRELTGLSDEKVIGREVREVLGLDFECGEDHVGTVLEWGVRQLGKGVTVNAEGDLPAKAVADLFPAYDDDGLAELTYSPFQHGAHVVRAAFEVEAQHFAHLTPHDLLVGQAGELPRAAPAADDAAVLVAHEERRVGCGVVVVQQLEQESEAALGAAARLIAEALLTVGGGGPRSAVRADEQVRHAV